MARAKKEKPDGFVIFPATLNAALLAAPEIAGRVFQAAANYFLNGIEPKTPSDLGEKIMLSNILTDIETSYERFNRRCKANQSNADKNKKDKDTPLDTNGDQWMQLETNGDQGHQ